MIISIIVAMDEHNGIGISGDLPWHLPDDLKRFKRLTMGHHLIIGRTTFESIGRPLPGRLMIVLSRNPDYQPEGVEKAHSLAEAIQVAQERNETEVFIGGGQEVYLSAIDIANRIYLTRVHAQIEADTFFPPIEEEEWDIVESNLHPADERHEFPFTCLKMERRQYPDS